MMATGYEATITTADNKQISRTSFHPENAKATLQQWIDQNVSWAKARNIAITWEIKEITGKTITKVGA